jgi:hypothetical protein
LAEHRQWPSEGIRFQVSDLYDLPKLELEPFDVTLFKGIFYHLPDPITGVKIAADLTRELLILNTAVRTDLPDGMLAAATESPAKAMSGVYGLNWFPTGPEVLTRILHWLGFSETRVMYWRKHADQPGQGRIQIAASREAGLLTRIQSVQGPSVHLRELNGPRGS